MNQRIMKSASFGFGMVGTVMITLNACGINTTVDYVGLAAALAVASGTAYSLIKFD
jgi:hypothetical protein